MSGRPVTQTGGASAYQKGLAAEYRTHVNGADRQHLNQIVHSGDKQPRPSNQYADSTNSYDPKAQAVINRVKDKLNK